MPELAHDCRISGGDGFWSRHRDDVSYNQLQKFWSGLPLHAKQALLRIDKQTLFEQARKNMYCSRCNGLLLEGFMQIIMYGKSLQLEGAPNQGSSNRLVTSKSQTVENVCLEIGGKGNESNDDGDVVQDPSVHPWGGLTTTRDGTLTLLDCYICSKSLKGLQNVFDSARARERERELLYPDACGGGGRGWISQGMVGYGRGHGTRETCALHTARLSVDTLVDFWSALGEETRFSLLRMKEEDFMERLMYRFDSKRFCRDCRKNVIREFKELKELKRIRRETRCTSAFCGADTSFQYEVTLDTIHADWHQNYADSKGLYAYYEWAVGTGEGKSDILDFENVGSKSKVQVSGLDLTGLNSCYITLRAWRTDGRRNEACVKAHALKGQHCVHGRLVVGDGFVTISRGESIRSFFEHAEEAEEEEDDDSIDKDGNEVDGECTRPQKHAKSPELAREFLLDAATVIFKEQVEKAFREGTARQNAHSMFVSLALKLLEQRVIVACKDIITLEKQFKLLEEEEKEKRDEEERKERRRAKEKEKKLRRKERLRIKELEKEKKCGQLGQTLIPDASKEDSSQLTSVNNEPDINDNTYCEEQEQEQEEDPSPQEDQILDDDENINSEFSYKKDENQSFGTNDQSKHNRRRLKSWNDYQHDQPSKWSDRSDRRRYEYGSTVNKPVPRYHSDSFETSRNGNKPVSRSNGSRYNDRSHCSHSRTSGRYDPPACNCYQQTYYRPKSGVPEPDTEASKPYLRRNKYNNSNVKKVWEPRSIIDSDDVTDRCADVIEPVEPISPNGPDLNKLKASGVEDSSNLKESESNVHIEPEPESGSTDLSTSSSNSNSDSCSSCLSEGDGNTSVSSNPQNAESSSTSDSEYANHHSEVMSEVVKETLSFLVSSGDIPPITSEPVKESCSEGNNIIPPPLQAQSMHFPVFQPPSMGYYHPGPVPWTTGPVPVPVPVPSTNGLMPLGPLPHSNYSMFASPYVYGNPRYGPYGVNGLQPLGPPLLNHPGQVPMYPPLKGVNDHITVHTKVIPVKGEQHVNSEKSWGQNEQKGNSGFSLFHFGGPVDVSNGLNGFKPDAADSVKDYVKKEVDFDDDCDCGEFKSMEEYDLFNASHGIEFSLF